MTGVELFKIGVILVGLVAFMVAAWRITSPK
jgi:hypothetical protein